MMKKVLKFMVLLGGAAGLGRSGARTAARLPVIGFLKA